jgi:hypothetical protein
MQIPCAFTFAHVFKKVSSSQFLNKTKLNESFANTKTTKSNLNNVNDFLKGFLSTISQNPNHFAFVIFVGRL